MRGAFVVVVFVNEMTRQQVGVVATVKKGWRW